MNSKNEALFEKRLELYKSLEDIRKRPVIIYVTSDRKNANGRIAQDSIREFIDQINKLPSDTTEIDVLINSTGGDGLTSWRIASVIREKIGPEGRFSVLVPHYAFSAATLLALGADEIYMHPLSCLGPVDPQIAIASNEGIQSFGYEDLVAFVKFLREEAKLTDQAQVAQLVQNLLTQVKPSILGQLKRASDQSFTMAKQLLLMHMKGTHTVKAEEIALTLNRSFFSHGHAVAKSEAKEIGLKISNNDSKVDDIIWKIYENLEEDLEMKKPFDPLALCLSDPANLMLLTPPPVFNLPLELPEQLKIQFYQQYLGNINSQTPRAVNYNLIHAVIESLRYHSAFKTKGIVLATRKPDLSYIVSHQNLAIGWFSNYKD